MDTFKPGDTFYYFDVVRVLGAGYHGAVYEIRHRQTGHAFALKTMHVADCVDPSKTARALAGARGNYQIDHRNVVQVLDLNCEADGLVWMRTELLKGHTVHELLARQGHLSLPFALAVATEAAFGLHAAHEAQIIHRDVKPSNLFYTEGREVKVIDLSLAKVFPEGLETTVGRRIGLGTPAYAAPEQLEGHVRPDVRFDVYGVGITLWEMLAGKHPFAEVLSDLPELIKRQLTVMPPLLADVAKLPPRVDAVVRRAVAKDPAERYSSMMEMARALMDLSAWAAGEARASRLTIAMPLGEPPLPGDANTWRDYRAPEPTPKHDAPESAPRDRVILAGPEPLPPVARRPLAATLPMNPPGGLARTVPLDDGSIGTGTLLTLRGTDLLPPDPTRAVASVGGPGGTLPRREDAPAPPAAAPPSLPTPAPARTPAAVPGAAAVLGGAAPARETPVGVTHSRAGAPPRRFAWPAVLVAVAVASLASTALVVWLLRRGSAPATSAPAQLAAPSTVTATPPTATSPGATPTSTTWLKVEDPDGRAPAASTSASAPTSATSSTPPASARPLTTPPVPRRASAPPPAAPLLPGVPYLPPPPPSHRVFGSEQ